MTARTFLPLPASSNSQPSLLMSHVPLEHESGDVTGDVAQEKPAADFIGSESIVNMSCSISESRSSAFFRI